MTKLFLLTLTLTANAFGMLSSSQDNQMTPVISGLSVRQMPVLTLRIGSSANYSDPEDQKKQKILKLYFKSGNDVTDAQK